MKLYNTLTRKIEDFIPNEEGKVKFYTCGPTVYHDQHIGNMRNYIGHDILDKSLRYLGYDVLRVMNITDVGHLTSDSDSGDDKMVKSAKENNKTVMEIAKYYTDQFFNDFKLLNNRVPNVVAPATQYIDDYIKIITKLLEKGYAYQSGGNVYFDISKLDDYYKLTNHKIDDMVVGVREGVSYDEFKKNQGDFALWFTKSKFEDQELKWDSPFGIGYPGWHKWCNYWFHNEHLMDESGKMSKSKGATLTVSLLKEQGYNPLAYRFMCINSHYRKQIVFSYDNLDNATNAYNKLKNRVQNLKEEGEINNNLFIDWDNKFKECLEDDLNIPNALTLVYDLLKSNINDNTKRKLIENWEKVLSLDLFKKEELDKDFEKEILEQIEKRNKAKKEKNYELADEIRNNLLKKGVILKDSREKTTYEIVK